VESNDDGQTWSPATDITDVLGDETFIPGPGVGIRLRTGRLLIPGYTNLYGPDGARIASYSCAVFSDDHGHSWQRGARVEYAMSNESQAVELTDGSVLINWRIQKKDDPPGCRGMARSEDGGATWSAPVLAQALNELPCQAGFMRLEPLSAAGADRLLFSNPDAHPGPGGDARTRMTVRLSLDGGRTWPLARRIHDGPSCYSCPARLPDGRIGLLYEYGEARRYERIRLARFSLDWLSAQTGGGDLRA
jgi:sialidase-1